MRFKVDDLLDLLSGAVAIVNHGNGTLAQYKIENGQLFSRFHRPGNTTWAVTQYYNGSTIEDVISRFEADNVVSQEKQVTIPLSRLEELEKEIKELKGRAK